MKGLLPRQTASIFEFLSKGYFLSEDSRDENRKELFNVLDEIENYELLYEYFLHIGFHLEKGNGYYYFSRKEKTPELEKKIERAYKWIDVLDFLKTYGKAIDEPFTQGTIFSPSTIFEECKLNHALFEKLDDLKRYYSKEKHLERIQQIVDDLRKETVIEIHNEFTSEYKVLASFGYFEKLILSISIAEDEHKTISE